VRRASAIHRKIKIRIVLEGLRGDDSIAELMLALATPLARGCWSSLGSSIA